MDACNQARRAAVFGVAAVIAIGLPSGVEAKHPRSQATEAARLARAVAKTHSKKAVLAVMRALHVGVYTPAGKRLVHGAERSARDFYLYEPEVNAIVRALAQHQTWSADDLAAYFTKAGFIRRGGKPWDAGSVRSQLAHAVKTAARQKPSLPGLLLRDLGLSTSQPKLNALQFFIVAADAFAPTIRRSRPAGGASGGGPCAGGPPVPGGWIFGGTGFSGAGESTHASGVLIDAIHGYLIANVGIDAQLMPLDGTETHYGPAGHEPLAGKQLEYRLTVRSWLAPNGVAIACGWLAHLSLPGSGGVFGATVHWITSLLDKHGQILPAQDTITDATGTTSLKFQPKDEAFPGFGTEHTDSGDVIAQVALDRLGPLSPYASFGPALLEAPWKVTYHKPRGFKFSGLKWRAEVYDQVYGTSYSQYELLSAHVCGEDPDVAWQTQIQEDSNWPLFGHYVFSGVVDRDWIPGDIMPARSSLGAVAKVDLIRDSPPATKLTMVFQPGYENSGVKMIPQVTSAPVEEDTSCPDNPD